MDQLPSIYETLINEIRDLKKDKRFKVNYENNFDTKGLKKAAFILKISRKTLYSKIHEEDSKLKKEKHYRISSTGFYTFNRQALLDLKGLL